ncbi:MAG: hypothetical protein E5W82_25235 [Mesorhizobium sp.]|nr:MAG: hypothetical protein E5W82_25235 [Mesorhizobium sp.]
MEFVKERQAIRTLIGAAAIMIKVTSTTIMPTTSAPTLPMTMMPIRLMLPIVLVIMPITALIAIAL